MGEACNHLEAAMASKREPDKKPPAPEPTEKKLPGVPSHLQAAVQQLIGTEPAPAKKPREGR